MLRAPFVISTAIVAGALALSIHLALQPDPFASGPSAVLAAGVLLFAVITAAGLMLSRGRWALRLAFTMVGAQFGLAMALDIAPWLVAALVLNGVALAGLAGPWLKGWLRLRPAADGPGPRPVLLLLGALAYLPAVAIASPSGLDWQHGFLAGIGVLGAWAYSRALRAGLWLLRFAIPLAAVAAAFASPPAGALYLSVHAVATTYLAWSGESVRAITPLLDRLYGPRAARPLDARAQDLT